MNKIYKLVWSKVKNCYVVASELAKSYTKSPKSGVIVRTVVAGVLACILSCGFNISSYAMEVIDDYEDAYNLYNPVGTHNYVDWVDEHDAIMGDSFVFATYTEHDKIDDFVKNKLNISLDGVSPQTHENFTYSSRNNGIQIVSDKDNNLYYQINLKGEVSGGREPARYNYYKTVLLSFQEARELGFDDSFISSSSREENEDNSFYKYQDIAKLQRTPNVSSVNYGSGALAKGDNSVALGTNAIVNEDVSDAVALGSNSVADVSNVVSVGSNDLKRRIVNVADGVDGSDVVTVGQLNTVVSDYAKRDMDNLSQAGEEAVRQYAKDAVKVIGSSDFTVVQGGDVALSDGVGTTAREYMLSLKKDGVIEEDNIGVVIGGTVYNEVRPSDGNFVRRSNTTAQNLSALDTKVKNMDDGLTENIGRIDTALEQHSDVMDGLRTDLDLVGSSVDTLQQNYDTVQNNVGNIQDSINTLGGRTDALEMDVQGLTTRTASLEGTVSSVEGRTASLETGLSDVVSRTGNLETAVNTMQGNVTALTDSVSGLQNTINGIQNDVGNLNTNVSEMQNTVGNLETATAGLETTVGGMQSDINSLNTDISGLQQDMSGVQASVTGLRTDVGVLQDDMTNAKSDISGLQTDMNMVKEDVSGVHTEIVGIKDNVNSIASDVNDVKETLGTVRSDVNGMRDDIASVQTNVDTLQETVNAVQTGFAGVQDDVNSVKSDVIGLKDSFAVMQSDVETAKNNVQSVQGDIVGVQADVASAQSDIMALQQEKANADGSNIDVDKWLKKIAYEAQGLLTNEMLYEEVRPSENGSVVRKDFSVGDNLLLLDGGLNRLKEDIKKHKTHGVSINSRVEIDTNYNGEGAKGDNSIAIGVNAEAHGEDGIAIGHGAKAMGIQSIAFGTGNKVTGHHSGAFGDPNEVTGDGSYAFGNDNTVSGDSTFVLGNNVINATGNNTVVLGNGSDGSMDNVVSIGSAGAERKIVHVADGDVSANSKEAVNGGQLYQVRKDLREAKDIDVSKWAEALGTGEVADGDFNLVTGGKVYTAIQNINTAGGTVTPDFVNGELHIGGNAMYDGIDVVNVSKSDGSSRVITGVATNPRDPASVANVAYVDTIGQSIVNSMNGEFNRVYDRVNKVGANAVALASLTPASFEGDEKWSLAASMGHYKGETAGAIGAFYRPAENVMMNVRGAVGNGENMIGAGVAVSLSKGDVPGLTKRQLARAVNTQADVIKKQASEIEVLKARMTELEKRLAER